MQKPVIQDSKSLVLLLFTAAFILLLGLNGRELWSLETRWANIVVEMLQSQDYFHPSLKGEPYYDKPLLSYWLIVLISKARGAFSAWELRLPSAIAALASIYFIYAIGQQLFDRRTGIIAGWFLVTTYYFVFWGRVTSADMLNIAGMLAAVWWFFRAPEKTTMLNYIVFFQIIALTCLCKGLLGVVLPALILTPYLTMHNLWRRHLNRKFFLAIIPALIVYLAPFYLSQIFNNGEYYADGLGLVFKENLTRFFAPFDHKGAVYTYLLYLPIYTLPWTPLFLIALVQDVRQWKDLPTNTKWLMWTIALLFAFFTASGSRRSYYILPLVPFAQLLAAVWAGKWNELNIKWMKKIGFAVLILLTLFFGVGLPWYYSGGGVIQFSQKVKEYAQAQDTWNNWHVVMLDVDNKVPFYIQTSDPFVYISDIESIEMHHTPQELLKNMTEGLQSSRTIFISQAKYVEALKPYFLDYEVILSEPTRGELLFSRKVKPVVAFIPKKLIW